MGQGYSLTTLSAGSAGIGVPELADLTYEKSLGTARFMKSIRARHRDGLVFVKVVMKPYSTMKLDPYVKEILRERQLLEGVPNALPYQRIIETSTNGYLVRQYLHSSLYDRMSTRPFLEDIEKKWLAFQLLSAVRDCHARDIYHGDIKTENILVTSWSWLYLSDFSSSFKPTFLPEDNPADFSYYFDTSGRRTCYLAPERFLGTGDKAEGKGKVTGAMDIFTVGCVIAELFLEAPIFSLSQLFKYRKGEHDPEHAHLSRLVDKDVREMVSHMIQVEPESRYSADEYLNFWRRKAFPEYFYSFLHQYMGLITDPSSGRAPVTSEGSNLGEADERINRVYYDFDKISYFLDYHNEETLKGEVADETLSGNDIIPVQVDIPNNQHKVSAAGRRPADDGTLIFLTLIVSSLRNSARAVARTRACDILLAFAERITDEAKLDRILPYVMFLLNDRAEVVQMAALRTLTQLMALVKVISPVNANVFPEYILPRLQKFVPYTSPRPKPVVRAIYASCLGSLATTASRFLDLMQALKADGSLPTASDQAEDALALESAHQTLFDVARNDVVEHFEAHVKALLTDGNTSVRRAFLGSVSSLCVFFGSSKANDVILSHLNTYLNDKDWMLRCAFFETIIGVATFVGATGLEEYILPLMVQALTDPEEVVVEKVIRSLAVMAQLGLFQRSKAWELVDIVGRFSMHPNIWIREATGFFLDSMTTYLSVADVYCIITPLVRPYLKTEVHDFAEAVLLDALRKPLPRPVFEMAVSWAAKTDRGLFWNIAREQRTFSFGSANDSVSVTSSRDPVTNTLSKVQKNDEDEQWLSRLRNIGMAPEDEGKLLALREYVWRMALSRPTEGINAPAPSKFGTILVLKDIDITPQTIFFDERVEQYYDHTNPIAAAHEGKNTTRHTITDALLDASMTIDEPPPLRTMPGSTSRRIGETLKSLETAGFSSQSPSPSPSSPDHDTGTEGPSPRPTRKTGRNKDLLSPTGDQIDTVINRTRMMRHKGSAVNLMNKKDSPKAVAETSTSSETVFGMVEGPLSGDARARSPLSLVETPENKAAPARFRALHTYEGRDPGVLKLLDALYLENFPIDDVEFGPLVTPLSRRQRIRKSSGQMTDMPWRPEGNLVAMFGEHTGPVNRVIVAPDHAFFITGSDDGMVKVWDSARLERNVAHRSRQTHKHAAGARVKALCFIENTHCFISAATDGAVHVVKVDYLHSGPGTKYGKLRLLKKYQLGSNEYAVWLEHFKSETQSVLMMATNHSRILALNLKTMTVMYVLENPVHHGTPTCFCMDKKHSWLLLGTTHGLLDLWDLRFLVRLKGWGLSGSTPIHRLIVHPLKGRGKWVCVAGGTGHGEITVWDVEKMQCREVYRSGGGKDRETSKSFEPWRVDEEKPEGMLGRFATSLEPNGNGSFDRGVRAFTMGLDSWEDGRDSRYGFFITVGSDRKVRYWDLAKIEASMVVSGLDTDEAKPIFSSSAHPTLPLTINVERIPAANTATQTAGKGSSNAVSKRGTGRQPRSTVISLQQQQLLKSHLDSILDVALLELPYGMTISVDRSGIIYVFQ